MAKKKPSAVRSITDSRTFVGGVYHRVRVWRDQPPSAADGAWRDDYDIRVVCAAKHPTIDAFIDAVADLKWVYAVEVTNAIGGGRKVYMYTSL